MPRDRSRSPRRKGMKHYLLDLGSFFSPVIKAWNTCTFFCLHPPQPHNTKSKKIPPRPKKISMASPSNLNFLPK